MKSRRRDLNRTFSKWLLSYAVLSIVAVLVISYCAARYSQALHSEMEYSNAVQLELVQSRMDRSVQVLKSFASKANLNRTVNTLRQTDSYESVPRYELYELVRDMAEEILVEEGNYTCFLYFPKLDCLVSGSYYNTSREFYDISFGRYGFSYEDWYEVIRQDYRTAQIFSLASGNGEPLAVLIKPLTSSLGVTAVNAIMIVDLNEILQSFPWLNQERDHICIVDRVNGGMVSNGVLDDAVTEELRLHLQEEASLTGRQFNVGSSVASVIESRYEKWDYVVITGEQPFVKRITELRHLVTVLIIGYLLVSMAAIGYSALRHFVPLKQAVDILHQEDPAPQMKGDAFSYVNESVHKLVDQNRENTNIILQQKNAIARELFHRLLTEKQAYAMTDVALLKQYGLDTDGHPICLLAYRMDCPETARELSWFILKNVTTENLETEGLASLCFQEGPREQVFLIWRKEDGEGPGDRAENAVRASREFIGRQFSLSYQSALSDDHPGIRELYAAYREAQSVFEYQEKEQGGGTVRYRDINLLPTDTLLKYPIDVENRLYYDIGAGDAEGACREIRFLLDENQANCLKPEAMQFLVSNITASVMRAAAKAWKEDGPPVSMTALTEASRQGDYRLVREELLRVTGEACRSMAEMNEREKGDQRGRICAEAKAYVEEHYSDVRLDVNSVAEHLRVQPSYLSRVFKEFEGDKLTRYINRVRLAHVKEMLSEDVKLEDVALRCGFGSQRTFLRIFKQYEGVTPTQYKEITEEKRGKTERSGERETKGKEEQGDSCKRQETDVSGEGRAGFSS